MRIISSDEIDFCLEDRTVLETLRNAFRSKTIAPVIAPLEVERPASPVGTLALQPAWNDFRRQGDIKRGYIGCGLSLDLPETEGPSASLYVLFSGDRGSPIALIDGMSLTAWRNAGLHALASSYLSREDAVRLLIIGDNPFLPRLLSAYSAVRKIHSILLAGVSPETRKRIIAQSGLSKTHVGVTTEISETQDGADMICIAGNANQAETRNALTYLDPPAGCHIDVLDPKIELPQQLLREARLFTSEASAPPHDGLEWAANLKDLAQGTRAGRRYYGQRTLFLPGIHTGLADHALAAHIFLRT